MCFPEQSSLYKIHSLIALFLLSIRFIQLTLFFKQKIDQIIMILLKIDNKLIFQTAEEIMYCNPPLPPNQHHHQDTSITCTWIFIRKI